FVTASSCVCCTFYCHVFLSFFLLTRPPPISPLFPYTTLFRSVTAYAVWIARRFTKRGGKGGRGGRALVMPLAKWVALPLVVFYRSEEHTSELQSRFDLVCRLLLEKKKKKHVILT